jgi:hypothetical protein
MSDSRSSELRLETNCGLPRNSPAYSPLYREPSQRKIHTEAPAETMPSSLMSSTRAVIATWDSAALTISSLALIVCPLIGWSLQVGSNGDIDLVRLGTRDTSALSCFPTMRISNSRQAGSDLQDSQNGTGIPRNYSDVETAPHLHDGMEVGNLQASSLGHPRLITIDMVSLNQRQCHVLVRGRRIILSDLHRRLVCKPARDYVSPEFVYPPPDLSCGYSKDHSLVPTGQVSSQQRKPSLISLTEQLAGFRFGE